MQTDCYRQFCHNEPKSHALMELLSEVNDAFCKSHPLLAIAQKVVTRSVHAAVSKIGAEALVSKAHVSIHDTCKSVVFT